MKLTIIWIWDYQCFFYLMYVYYASIQIILNNINIYTHYNIIVQKKNKKQNWKIV